MKYYVLKAQQIIAETFSREEAIELVERYQARETHYLLRAEFSIIEGKPQEFIKCSK